MAHLLKTSLLSIRGHSASARTLATISYKQCGIPSEVLRSAPSVASAASVEVGSIKVAIKASSVSVEDVRKIRGVSAVAKTSGTAGSFGAGMVSSVPVGEGEFSANDFVLVIGGDVWADEAVVSKANAIKLPKGAAENAAVLPSYISAWGILHNFVSLKAGDVVVQTAGNTAVGSAITNMGKALGLKVVSLADADVKSTNLAAKLQELGNIKLAVSGNSGKHISSLQRHVSKDGSTVVYNGVYEPLHTVADVQLPISHMIFSNSSVHGFDLQAWFQSDAAGVRSAVTDLLKVVQDKQVPLKAEHSFPQADYLKAIEEVTKSGASVVLKH